MQVTNGRTQRREMGLRREEIYTFRSAPGEDVEFVFGALLSATNRRLYLDGKRPRYPDTGSLTIRVAPMRDAAGVYSATPAEGASAAEMRAWVNGEGGAAATAGAGDPSADLNDAALDSAENDGLVAVGAGDPSMVHVAGTDEVEPEEAPQEESFEPIFELATSARDIFHDEIHRPTSRRRTGSLTE